MADRVAKDALFDAFASAAKALGSGRRAELIDVLVQGPRTVEELAVEIDQSLANTSHHLQVLSRAGLVLRRREGNRVVYSLSSERVSELWAAVRDVATGHVAGFSDLAERYLGPRETLKTITRDELALKLDQAGVAVFDVRPRAEFDAGHIRGAFHVEPVRPKGVVERGPQWSDEGWGQLHEQVRELPDGADMIVYCRGSYCAFAAEVLRELHSSGHDRAVLLEDGFPEWRRAGLPVE